MKILPTLLILIFLSTTTFGQVDSIYSTESNSITQLITELKKRDSTHFTFKGIPIDGSLNHFVDELKKLNFAVIKSSNVDAILTGKFTGQEVHVLVQASSKAVYSVTVMFESQPSWKAIKTQYENVKYNLIEKYGQPKETVEKFDAPYDKVEGLEFLALSDDKCTYMTQFATPTGNGMIRLSISSEANLVINYVDSINYLIVSGEALNEY